MEVKGRENWILMNWSFQKLKEDNFDEFQFLLMRQRRNRFHLKLNPATTHLCDDDISCICTLRNKRMMFNWPWSNVERLLIMSKHTLVSVYDTSVDLSGPWPGLAITVMTLLPSLDDIFILMLLFKSFRYNTNLIVVEVVLANVDLQNFLVKVCHAPMTLWQISRI